jgi:hypothetical protein
MVYLKSRSLLEGEVIELVAIGNVRELPAEPFENEESILMN